MGQRNRSKAECGERREGRESSGLDTHVGTFALASAAAAHDAHASSAGFARAPIGLDVADPGAA